MFVSVNYSQLKKGNLCRSSVITVKETYWNRKVRFSVLSRVELSFLDLQEVGGVDSQGMMLDVHLVLVIHQGVCNYGIYHTEGPLVSWSQTGSVRLRVCRARCMINHHS